MRPACPLADAASRLTARRYAMTRQIDDDVLSSCHAPHEIINIFHYSSLMILPRALRQPTRRKPCGRWAAWAAGAPVFYATYGTTALVSKAPVDGGSSLASHGRIVAMDTALITTMICMSLLAKISRRSNARGVSVGAIFLGGWYGGISILACPAATASAWS